MSRPKPDIRAITRLVPPAGNLVQGQSELPIDPALAQAAAKAMTDNQNHYGPAEGVPDLRRAVAAKIAECNQLTVDPEAKQLELMITNGGTGALISLTAAHLRGASVLLFEPFYPYHRRITEEFGGKAEAMPLRREDMSFDKAELRRRCAELKNRGQHPLRAIVVCSPANPTGKVFTRDELQAVAEVCQEQDLLCIADEVYEHYVTGSKPHVSMASLPGMWERTVTVNSFSKSWNISGWRLGYAYGPGKLIAPMSAAANVFYVNPATPLQVGLAKTVMADSSRYRKLGETFTAKWRRVAKAFEEMGFKIYDSGSAFYIWAQAPAPHRDAMVFNQMLLEKFQVAGVPGAAFADSEQWDDCLRFCIAREDHILESAVERIRKAVSAVGDRVIV